MIPDKNIASAVSNAAEGLIKELSLALNAAGDSGSAEELERLRKAIGEVIGTMETALLWPLYRAHPELEPENLKGWENEG